MELKDNIRQFSDSIGRMDLKPVYGGKWTTNNNLLYTGELAVMMFFYNKKHPDFFTKEDFDRLLNAIKHCEVTGYPGLFSRHPEPYRRLLDSQGRVDFRPTSFDEIVGAKMTSYLAESSTSMDIYNHGKNNHWQYNDVPNHEKGISRWSVIFNKNLISNLKSYFKDAGTYDTGGLRKAAQHHSSLYPIFFTHSNSNRIVYSSDRDIKPSIGDSIIALFSSTIAAIKGDNTSTKLLWFFRFKYIEATGKDNLIIKSAKFLFKTINKLKDGDDWKNKYFNEYYVYFHPLKRMAKEIEF